MAFAKSQAFRHVTHKIPSAVVSNAMRQPTVLGALGAQQIIETSFTYFDSVKVSSTLIAASSMTALFTFTGESKETFNFSRLHIMLLRIYHVFSLLSFCLSLTAVLTSQAASSSLLLNNSHALANRSGDVFSFLRTYMNFEFVLTRWSMFTSIVFFFLSTTFRMLVEFGLFSKTRRLAGTMVSAMMSGVICFMFSFANTANAGLPGPWSMTKEVVLVSGWLFRWIWYHSLLLRFYFLVAATLESRFRRTPPAIGCVVRSIRNLGAVLAPVFIPWIRRLRSVTRYGWLYLRVGSLFC